MRYKVVPQPVSDDRLLAAKDALPLVPGSVEDCCTRIRDRTEVPSREDAREWLTFLQALGLARETDRGYHRVRETPDNEALGEAFLDDVFLASELLEVLGTAEGPLSPATAFEAVRESIPRWERDRDPDWEDEWRERVEALLEWGVVFEVFDECEGGYEPAAG